jgi:hypothetical protein
MHFMWSEIQYLFGNRHQNTAFIKKHELEDMSKMSLHVRNNMQLYLF